MHKPTWRACAEYGVSIWLSYQRGVIAGYPGTSYAFAQTDSASTSARDLRRRIHALDLGCWNPVVLSLRAHALGEEHQLWLSFAKKIRRRLG
jgi:hypothetical protein